MAPRILVVGRLQERVDDLVAQLGDLGLVVTGTADLRQAAPSVAVRVEPDRTGGPAAMIPFVQQCAADHST